MDPQIIVTATGEELVVLPRRDYEALLARMGNEEAEDRVTRRIVTESRARVAAGQEELVQSDASGRPSLIVVGSVDAQDREDQPRVARRGGWISPSLR